MNQYTMSKIEYLVLRGDMDKKLRYDNVDLSGLLIGNNVPDNHLMSFGILEDSCPKEVIWDFFKRNKHIVSKTRSLHFVQRIQESEAIKYFHDKLEENFIKYSLSNFSLGAIFTVNERFLSSGNIKLKLRASDNIKKLKTDDKSDSKSDGESDGESDSKSDGKSDDKSNGKIMTTLSKYFDSINI
jgi:hypothetical protein